MSKFIADIALGLSSRNRIFNSVIIFACIAVVFLGSFYFRVADNDLFARLAVGRLVAETGQIPDKDIFAFTQTKSDWIDHEWLAGVLFFAANQLGGDLALFLLNISLGIVTVLMLHRAQAANGIYNIFGPIVLFFVVLQISFIWNSTIRSQIFTFFCFSYLLWALTEWHRRWFIKYLIPVPLIFIFWGNAHGGFVVGLGFLCLSLFAAFLNRSTRSLTLAVIIALSISALFMNPYGLRYLEFIFEAVLMPRHEISEWWATPLAPQFGIFWVCCFIIIVFALMPRYRRQVPLEGWFFLTVSLVFACKHLRHIPFFLLTAALYLPPLLSSFYTNAKPWVKERIHALIGTVLVISYGISIAGVLSLFVLLFNREQFSLDYAGYPVRSVQWLKGNEKGGDILAHFDISSFILYQLGPKFKVAVDGRYEEVYPQATFDLANLALRPDSPGHAEAVLAIDPDFIILCEPATPLNGIKKFPGEWLQIYSDASDGCAVFSQSPPKVSGEKSDLG